jgi:acyl carrier protein
MANDLHDKIFSKVAQVISNITGTGLSELYGVTALQTDLGMDSLALFEVVVDLEEAFGMQITDEDVDRIKTIDDIVRFIEKTKYSMDSHE